MAGMSKKVIEIHLSTKDHVRLESIVSLQGNLKETSPGKMRKLKESMKKNGIRFPVFIWKHEKKFYSIDGIHRKMALKELESEGYEIPADIPCVFIEAKDKKEARKLLLLASSNYAKVTQSGFDDFALGFDYDELFRQISIDGLELSIKEKAEENDFDIDEMKLKDFESYDYIVFLFSDSRDFLNILQRFCIKRMSVGYSDKNKKTGIGRIIKGEMLLEALDRNTNKK